MNLNGVTLVDRHNRPTTIQKVALQAFFINDGSYYDPYDISGVTVFEKTSNTDPATILDGNVISPTLDTSLVKMHFGKLPTGTAPTNYHSQFPLDNPATLSGIFKTGTGQYVCVLDGTRETSGMYNLHEAGVVVQNSADSVQDYIDCWTVKFSAGSEYQTLINDFHLFDDTFFTTTQKILLSTRNKLINKKLTLDSIENLKITTEITIQNKDIDTSIKNIFKDSAITNASIKIDKVNEDAVALPGHVEVVSFIDSTNSVDITSDNTLVYRFDTTTLATHPSIANFGGVVGTYRIVAKYDLLDETIITPPYFFTVS